MQPIIVSVRFLTSIIYFVDMRIIATKDFVNLRVSCHNRAEQENWRWCERENPVPLSRPLPSWNGESLFYPIVHMIRNINKSSLTSNEVIVLHFCSHVLSVSVYRIGIGIDIGLTYGCIPSCK